MHRTWPKDDPLGFGFGDHRCIAEYLAKAELTSAFSKISSWVLRTRANRRSIVHLYQKVPNVELATAISDIEYSPLHKDVGIAKLLVTF
jgi:nitric oxide reductase